MQISNNDNLSILWWVCWRTTFNIFYFVSIVHIFLKSGGVYKVLSSNTNFQLIKISWNLRIHFSISMSLINLVQGFQKASRFWKSLIGYLTTTIMILIYKWASFEFCAEVLIFLMNFFSLNEVFRRFGTTKTLHISNLKIKNFENFYWELLSVY